MKSVEEEGLRRTTWRVKCALDCLGSSCQSSRTVQNSGKRERFHARGEDPARSVCLFVSSNRASSGSEEG